MNNLKLAEEEHILKRLNEDIDFYKQGLQEILVHLNIRSEIVDTFKGTVDELHKYIQVGEILNDIMDNYVDYESVCNSHGEIVDFKKIYQVKAEQAIINTQTFLFELEEDGDVDERYIRSIKMELTKYKSKSIFDELIRIETLLGNISEDTLVIYEEVNEFISNLKRFNKLEGFDKYSYLNTFCYKNIDISKFVDKVTEIYNAYNGLDVVINIHELERLPLFSKWNIETLRPILKDNSMLYFKIISTLNTLQCLSDDLLNVNLVKQQVNNIDELQKCFIVYKN